MEPLILRLEGEWDIYRREELSDQLRPAYTHPNVIVDLSRVEYMDSTGLSAFVRMRNTRKAAGFAPSRFVIVSPNVRRIFELTGLDNVWPIYDSLEAALRAPDLEVRP